MAFPRYSQPNVITLGSLEYVTDGEITVAPAMEYAVGLRMGSPNYDTREGAQFRNYNDFRGGLGVRVGDAREFPDRFWAGRAARTWASVQDITLAPLLVECTLGAIVPSYPAASPAPGGAWAIAPDAAGTITLFGAMGDKVFANTNASTPAFAAITPGGGPAGAQTAGLLYHVNPTNLSDRGLFWATGLTDEIWKRNLDAGTWSQPHATQKSDHLIEFDRKLLSVFAGQVSISADGGVSWTDIVKVPTASNFRPFWAGVGLDVFGQLMPYLVSAGTLYAIDVWTRQAIIVELGLPSNVTAAICWQDGEVIATDGFYVKAYHPSRPVKDMGFNRDGGMETLHLIRNFTVIAGKYLVAHCDVGANILALLLWDGVGWHTIEAGDAIFGPFGLWSNGGSPSMIHYNGASVYSPAQEIYVMSYVSGRPWIYHMAADAFKNPQLNGAHKYASYGWVKSTWFDGGFAEMAGTAIEVEVHGVFDGNNKKLTLSYAIDNGTVFNALGATSGSDTVQRFQFASGAGISFKNIQFLFELSRGATTTHTPVIRAIIFKYLKKPRLRSQYVFSVDVAQSARHQGVTEEVLIDTLYAKADDTPLLPLGYVGESTVFVDIKELPRRDAFWQTGTTKTGSFRVVCEEPV